MTASSSPSKPSWQDDPVALEIMWSRLLATADEMWTTVLRTAVSPVIGSAQDFGCELLDADGNGLAHAARSMPVFNLVMPIVTRAIIERFPPESMRPGDVYITNDPWLCAGHPDDIATITPIFHNGKLAAFASTVAHASSIGGTLDRLSARDRYEEGLLIPPDILYRDGKPNSSILAILEANVRQPEMVMADLAAQVAANEVGARRTVEFLREYDLDDLASLASEVQRRSERAMRESILKVPDGNYASEEWVETPQDDILLKVAVTIDGDSILVDYSGSAPEQRVGGMNCTLTYTSAHTVYPLKCLLTPTIHNNEGCFRPIDIRVPEGTILNASRLAAVGSRTQTGWHIHGLLFNALYEAFPDRIQAGNGLMNALYAAGTENDGRPFTSYFFSGGGRGAGNGQHGPDYNCFPSSAGNVPVEVFESRAPILVEERAVMYGSGGRGESDGADGHRYRLRKLPQSNADVSLYLHPDRLRHPAPGLYGGQSGNLTRVFLNGRDLTNGTGTLTDGEVILSSDDDVFTCEAAGGGGFGESSTHNEVAPIEKS